MSFESARAANITAVQENPEGTFVDALSGNTIPLSEVLEILWKSQGSIYSSLNDDNDWDTWANMEYLKVLLEDGTWLKYDGFPLPPETIEPLSQMVFPD